ncbi:MAG TPA: choice-of-anchor tandem repeat GloVer-containing protein, partial [Candidatus Cybelea sp.]|nr:choice-of-anchor tandem repeat GloVer-containing protein [Candidatus Cybelea sp.]
MKAFAGLCFSAALVAACSAGSNGVVPSTAIQGANARHGASVRHATGSSGGYQILHSFGGTGDGFGPRAGLAVLGGVLYGTTFYGGTHGYRGGAAFSITTGGTESVLYDFGLGSDASRPWAGLTSLNGVLYGTTYGGGTHGYAAGTIFSLTTAGAETVLHNFGSSGDGVNPIGGQLVALNGVLYGTTANGGANGLGIVFSITTSGTESVLHTFGGTGDGAHPFGGLVAVNGVLYGTTAAGGTNGDGTIFSITTGGSEAVLHNFGSSGDGVNPETLSVLNGALYGTTGQGGAYGKGTVFSTTTSGNESVLYSFGGSGGDGITPGEIRPFGGLFYGTTNTGGAFNDGTVFSITTSGTETVLHSFGGSGDGVNPVGVKPFGGTLYGTTVIGGAHNAGVVFELPIPITET